MNTQRQIAIDRFVGLPLAWLLNGAAHVVGWLMRRDHSVAPERVRTIAVSKYVGMGSILQATPLLRSIKARYPEAQVIFVTSHACRQMVERLEHVDRIVVIDERGLFQVAWSSLGATVALMRARVDLFFDLEVYSAYASIMALLSLSRNRIGFFRLSAQHKQGNYTHLMYMNTRQPIRYIYLQLGRLVGCVPVEPERLGRIRIDARDREEVATRLARFGAERGRYVLINPNASDLLLERRWPAPSFAAYIDRFVASRDEVVLLIGAPSDRPYVESVLAGVREPRGRVHDLAGELSLGGFFALLEGAACLVTNDTGPMHMAWSIGTPTVCMFGPGDPRHYAWEGKGVEVVHRDVYCSPCLYHVDFPPCNGDNVCMKRITVEEVMAATNRILDGVSPPPRPQLDPDFFQDADGRPLGRAVRGVPKS